MLRGIRKASANWLGRTVMGAVMGLLVLSFAIWGINDIFRGFGRSTVAKIGSTEIPIEEFRRVYNERLQQLSRQVGQPVTPEQASAAGLDRQVLSEMVAEAGLDQRIRQLHLAIPDSEIVERITADPTFKSPTGSFDRLRFQQLIRSAGYTEQRFIAEQRKVALRREIVDSLTAVLPVPKAWLSAINQFQNEERSIAYLQLGPAQAGDIPQPTADELNKYFEARKILFRAPEYRKVSTVQVTPADLGKWMDISEADIKAAYEEHHNRYVTPERRHVEQMVFPKIEDADTAAARLKDGLTFAALAGERGLKDQDIDLGTVPKSEIVDPAVADAAFSLKEGEVSAPIKGRFGTVIVTVIKIEPEQTKPLADVTAQIRNDIAAERAKSQVRALHDQIEDARAGGSTLEEAAKKANLQLVNYEIDRSGRDPSGKPVSNLPHAADVIAAAFTSDVGVENDPVTADGGYVWYDVTTITPAHDRTLDEVKSEVEARWREDEIATRLKAKAADFLDKLKNGASLDDVAKAENLKVESADNLQRNKPAPGLSAKIVGSVFRTAKDAFGSAAGDQPTDWVVFRVTAVSAPKVDANLPEEKRIEETLQSQENNDILGQYVSWLQEELGLSVNQAALAQALGNAAPDTN
ncbi:MAG: peptidyl-prolyl cis-trans isomerase [Xanthobacteraceae bacterium]|jgi:peptidyl-prolyl cis-trans isomerase D